MFKQPFVLVTDRGGHLHNALKLMEQLQEAPQAIVTTHGPDIDSLRASFSNVETVPYLFSWWGKFRWFNPWGALQHILKSYRLAKKLRPKTVVSLGASNVVVFCYLAKWMGAQIIHVECMNQVTTRSITGRMLYPICREVLVQWPELLKAYGPKARYEGWVL